MILLVLFNILFAQAKKASAAAAAATAEVFVNTTPKGEKKDLSAEMAPGYKPGAVEAAWQVRLHVS